MKEEVFVVIRYPYSSGCRVKESAICGFFDSLDYAIDFANKKANRAKNYRFDVKRDCDDNTYETKAAFYSGCKHIY